MRVISIFILLFFLAKHTLSQEAYVEQHYTIKQGLPSNTVYKVFEDEKGFLWFFTDKGISIYNNYEFKNYGVADGLSDDDVFGYYVDTFGRKWIQTFNGTKCYYKNGFHSEFNDSTLKRSLKSKGSLRNIFMGKNKKAYFCYVNRIHTNKLYAKIYCAEKENFMEVNIPESLKTDTISTFPLFYFNIVGDDTIYIRNKSMHIVGKHTQKTIPYERDPYLCNFEPSTQNSYLYSSEDNILHVFNGLKEITNYKLNSNVDYKHKVNHVQIKDSIIYLSTSENLCMYDLRTRETKYALLGDHITSTYGDKFGNLWVTSYFNGVYKINKSKLLGTCFKNNITDVIKNISDGTDIFLLSSSGKIYRKSGKASQEVKLTNSSLLRKNSIYYKVAMMFKGKLVLIYGDTVHLFKKLNNNTYKEQFLAGAGSKAVNVKQVFPFQNELYFITPYGISKLSTNDSFQQIIPEFINERMLTAGGLGNCLYLCTHKKTYQCNKSIKLLKTFDSVLYKKIACTNTYLIGISNQNEVQVRDQHFKLMYQKQMHKSFDKIEVINDQYVIVIGKDGPHLLEMDKTGKFSFNKIVHADCPREASNFYLLRDTCFFIANGTLRQIPIKEIVKFKTNYSRIYFEKLITKNASYWLDTNYVKINYKENSDIRLLIKRLNFSDIDQFVYISINGADWTLIKGTELLFDKLNIGLNHIKLKSIHTEQSVPALCELIIEIPAPFYLSKWAYLFYTILGLLLLYLIIIGYSKFNFKQQQKKYEGEIMILKSEFNFLNSLMNPHFVFNSLNNIQRFINEDNKKVANKYLSLFSKTIRKNYANIFKQQISLQDEIELVQNYLDLEKLRYEDRFRFTLEKDNSIDLTAIQVPPLILQPLVENALKHGLVPLLDDRVGNLSISIQALENDIVVKITDDGVGMNPDKLYDKQLSSIHNIMRRIETFNKINKTEIKLRIEPNANQAGSMALLRISLPLK